MEEQKWSRIPILRKLLDEVDEVIDNTSFPNNARFVDAAVREKVNKIRQEVQENGQDDI